MQIRQLLILTILGLSFAAAADFRTVMEVYEVDLIYLRLPGTASGTLAFSECADCNTRTIRVSPATRYVVNGQTVALADFRKVVAGITDRRNTIVDVFHDLESDAVTTVRVKI